MGLTHDISIVDDDVTAAKAQIILKPTFKETAKAVFSFRTALVALPYFTTFGAELAVNSILGAFYIIDGQYSQTQAGNLAAIFGLLNVVTRPMGGYLSDRIYLYSGNVQMKKYWMLGLGVIEGVFMIAIGAESSGNITTLVGLVAGLAIFLEAANGANFSVVPHINPQYNGTISGIVGGTGNLGGIIFSLIFRYNGTNYHKAFWIIGILVIAINAAVVWIVVPHTGESKHQLEKYKHHPKHTTNHSDM